MTVQAPRKPFYRDRWFCSALLAGGVFWLGLSVVVPIQPLAWQQVASWQFLMFALWQPCGEELMFRGVLQGWAGQYTWGQQSWGGISGANAVTACLFMVAHWWAHPPLWATAVLVPGLLFGACRDRYGSVVPAIVLHVIYNTGYFWLTGLPV